jgi:hypothetical protein
MSLPGYSAESSLRPPYGRRAPACGAARRADPGRAEEIVPAASATGLSPGRARGLGFACDGGLCVCSGDRDCGDMFGTNVCGPNAICFLTGATGVVCLCAR